MIRHFLPLGALTTRAAWYAWHISPEISCSGHRLAALSCCVGSQKGLFNCSCSVRWSSSGEGYAKCGAYNVGEKKTNVVYITMVLVNCFESIVYFHEYEEAYPITKSLFEVVYITLEFILPHTSDSFAVTFTTTESANILKYLSNWLHGYDWDLEM